MTLKLSDFAPELLNSVFCFCSQSDLASLSRVNNTFRNGAEYLLHRDIHISFCLDIDPEDSRNKIFCTLTSNPQKAASLRYLHVKLVVCDEENHIYRTVKQIGDALRNTHGLEDLRIIVMRPEHMYRPSDPSKGMLSEIIKGGYFQLHTLYCDSYQDLEGIIISQKRLRLLGIYTNHYRSGCVNVAKLINNSRIDSNRNFPGIFMLFCSDTADKFNRLILFPELCFPGQTFMLCRDIAKSLGQDLSKYNIMPPADHHGRLTIHVFDFYSAKTVIICEVVKAMAKYFVNCEVFTVWVQSSVGKETVSKPWRIPGVSTSINLFKQLRKQLRPLNFYVPNDPDDPRSLRQTVYDLNSLLYKEFDHAIGLRLVRVCLDDCSMIARREWDRFCWETGASKNETEDDEVYSDTLLID